jgi:hypothetical protein
MAKHSSWWRAVKRGNYLRPLPDWLKIHLGRLAASLLETLFVVTVAGLVVGLAAGLYVRWNAGALDRSPVRTAALIRQRPLVRVQGRPLRNGPSTLDVSSGRAFLMGFRPGR